MIAAYPQGSVSRSLSQGAGDRSGFAETLTDK
jgi:hypothetical protein